MTKTAKTTFRIIDNNLRRRGRGAKHLEVEIFEDGDKIDWAWMDFRDVEENKKEFGEDCFVNIINEDGSVSDELKIFEFHLNTPLFSNKSTEELVMELWPKQYPKLGDILDNDFRGIRFARNGGYIISIASYENLSKLYPTYDHVSSDFEIEGDSTLSNEAIETASDIDGTTAILEGDLTFTEGCMAIKDLLEKEGKHIMGISELYRLPDKLADVAIKDIDNLIIDTTLFNDKVNELVGLFKSLNYSPRRVFFLNESIMLPIEGCRFFKLNRYTLETREIGRNEA